MKATKTAIVIGGGIAGCSTAFALAQRGLQVTLYERQPNIANEASGNPIAMLYPRLSGENTASQFALAAYLYSLSLFKTLNLSISHFNPCGMLQLGFNARELARIQKVAASTPANIAYYVSATKASDIAGIPVNTDALFFPQAAWVHPKPLCVAFTSHKNISVFTSKNITKLLKNNGIFELYADENLINTADIVIIANANDAQKLLPMSQLSTQAVRGQVSQLQVTASSQKLQTIVCSDGYLSPAIAGEHSLGATFSAQDTTVDVTPHDHFLNLAKLKHISADLYETMQHQILAGRTSFRCVAQDHFPLVGELLNAKLLTDSPPRPTAQTHTLPWISGLHVNIAHGSHGFITAPLSAEILACLICNETLPIDATLIGLLNPNRFLLRTVGLKKLAKSVATSHRLSAI